jgi:hypothetical protein
MDGGRLPTLSRKDKGVNHEERLKWPWECGTLPRLRVSHPYLEGMVLAIASHGVRASVVRLPPSVHDQVNSMREMRDHLGLPADLF